MGIFKFLGQVGKGLINISKDREPQLCWRSEDTSSVGRKE
jgi:hypothetical protein